jgi:hypothetical protein
MASKTTIASIYNDNVHKEAYSSRKHKVIILFIKQQKKNTSRSGCICWVMKKQKTQTKSKPNVCMAQARINENKNETTPCSE